jgi:glycosyltransferase involved in cell wall biosynthesis
MRLLATVTLNPNQLRSHLLPLVSLPAVDEIILVADEPPPPIAKVRAVVPSPQRTKVLGRAASKLVTCTQLARRHEPDWILSYNVMPHGVNGYVAGRLSGTPTVYHMIGGELEWLGGGWQSDNAILGRLPRAVPALETALLALIRGNDVVCTMGNTARERLLDLGFDADRVAVTPPSVDCDRFSPSDGEKRYDLVTVAEFIPRKRLEDFVALVARLRSDRPEIRAAIAGSGPLEAEIRRVAVRAGVGDAIDFLGVVERVEDVYRAGRVFVLTSRHEGLSVAMTEAMACGLPVVVTDVGDLRDLVDAGENGALVPVGDVDALATRTALLLDDDEQWRRASAAARRAVVDRSSVEAVAAVYARILGTRAEEVERAA